MGPASRPVFDGLRDPALWPLAPPEKQAVGGGRASPPVRVGRRHGIGMATDEAITA